MAEFSEKLDREKMDNLISVILSQRYTIIGLQDYVSDSMKRIHEHILQKLPAGVCGTNCSRKFRNQFRNWCKICRCWKDELHKLCRYKNHWKEICWNEIDTTDFPHKTSDSYEAVAKVFISKTCWYTHSRKLFFDLGAIMSLFWNVNTFTNISNNVISDIRDYRNFCYGHNYTAELDDVDKNKYLGAFIKLLEVPDILCTSCAKTALKIIKELQSTNGIPSHIVLSKEGWSTLIMVRNGVQDQSSRESSDLNLVSVNPRLQHIERGMVRNDVQDESSREYSELNLVSVNRRNQLSERIGELIVEAQRTHLTARLHIWNVVIRNKKKGIKMASTITLIIMFVYSIYYGMSADEKKHEGCMSMRYLKEWKSDINFDFYVESLNNESFVERHWLKTIIEENIQETSRGVLITADMGFGKSSLVSNLLCAERLSIWYDLRKHILAYHFCKHDCILSAGAHTFIRNLAGAIVDRYPEMGNDILLDQLAADFLNDVKCAKDSIGCLEIGILGPLRNRWTRQKFLIVIDAIDECDTGGGNTLLELLATQIQKFPSNVKFILTSRNIEYISRKFQDISTMHINASNKNNIRDIRQFIQSITNLTENQINTLTSIAGGNFQHVKHYLQDCQLRKNCDFTNIPNSLEKLYEENFYRIFKGKNSLFDDLTPAFEVLCTLQKPLYEEQLMSISNISVIENRRKLEQLLGNELGHFIKKENGQISFIHKSISDFLTNESRNHSKFFIRKENGHKLFAEYLFKTLNISDNLKDNLAELVYHVAMSLNSEFETMLNGYVKFLMKKDPLLYETLLHRVAQDYNNYHTMNLILSIKYFKGVNSVNERNHSVAFVAASRGNHNSLKCLLDRGANQNFRAIFDTVTVDSTIINKSLIIEHSIEFGLSCNGSDIVFMCKYVHFCGYNLLQIAAQYGHTKVVKMLLDRHKNLLYVENDMHINAFHLAVENGHFEIVQMFLEHDPSFADVYSLYQAAKNGHLSVAQLLISHGVKDGCLPCNGTFYWMPIFSNRKQNPVKIRSFKSEKTLYRKVKMKTVFYDDWRLIMCESALNVAVRSGHFEIVQILTEQTENALDCTMFDGKTPLMTAVQYNRTEIFKYLYKKYERNILLFKCFHSYDIFYINLELKLDMSEKRKLTAEQCPSGATIVHLLAIYGNFDMLRYMYNSGFSYWDLRDSQEATPLHYAFCHNNVNYIIAAHQLGLNFSARTLNGSTVFHSASICRSLALYILSKRQDAYRMEIPDSFDKAGRSILHYSMLLGLSEDDQIEQGSITNDGYQKVLALVNVLIESKHNLHRLDDEGKNFLHYAAKSGNYLGFKFSKHILTDIDFHLLLNHKDYLGRTPFDELFFSMRRHESFQILKIPSGCEIKDLFYKKCNTNFELILTNHEMGIWEISKYLYYKREFALYNITNLLMIAIHKSRMYPVLILKTYAEDIFKVVTFNNPELLSVVTEYEGPNIAEFILTKDNALKCDGSFSPLHKIITNDRNTIRECSGVKFLNHFLAEYTAQTLDECFDNCGFNLLHRAVIGGNILAVQYLVAKGMNTSRLSRTGLHPLVISVTQAPYLENSVLPSYYTDSYFYQNLQFGIEKNVTHLVLEKSGPVDFDETSKLIVQTEYTSKTFNQTLFVGILCKSAKKHLGLIHLAAAKGFIKFLKKCKELFGIDQLNCRDYYHITPVYLAQIYNQTKVVNWMQGVGVQLTKPGLEIESLLAYNFLSNFRTFYHFDWICSLKYSYRYVALTINQIRKCLPFLQESNSEILYKSPFDKLDILQLLTIPRLLHIFETDIANKTYPTFEYKLCHLNMTLCSLSVTINTGVIHQFKTRHKQVYLLFRKIIKFGVSDRMFWFQRILDRTFKENSLKYIEAFSFHSIFCFHYRYLEQLTMPSDLHKRWLYKHVQSLEESQNYYLDYCNRKSNFILWIYNELVNMNSLFTKFINNRALKASENYEAMHSCQNCDFENNALKMFSDICSVNDVYEIETECLETNSFNKLTLTEKEMEFIISSSLQFILRKARNDSVLMEKYKLFQRNALMVIYFMQYIPESRNTSQCMRYIRLTAEKVAALKL